MSEQYYHVAFSAQAYGIKIPYGFFLIFILSA